MSLNFHWFQKYKLSKLEETINKTLTACIFGTNGSSETHCTVPHFKGLIELYMDLQSQGCDSTSTFRHTLLK